MYGPGSSGYDCVITWNLENRLRRIAAAHQRERAREVAGGARRGLRHDGRGRRRRGRRGLRVRDRGLRSGSAGVCDGRRRPAPAAAAAAAAPAHRTDALIDLRLAVAAGLQFGQRRETLLHAFVVDAVARALGVDLVRRDGLFFERERLLLEQRVVFVELIGRELLRPLGLHDVLAQLAVDLGDLVGRQRGDFGHVVVSGGLVAVERGLHRLALLGQRLALSGSTSAMLRYSSRAGAASASCDFAARYCVRSVRPAPAVRSALTISRCQ